MIRHAAWFGLLVACGHRGDAPRMEPVLGARIAAYLAPFVQMHDFAGVVLVARGDRIVFHKAFGDAPAHAPYAVGSIAKTVTAAAIELLAARGKLSLADPIGRHVRGLPYGARVTIAQLLAHRAGVPDYDGFPEFARGRATSPTLAELVALIAAKPLDFAPGSDERYSNSGYALLAAAIEHASGSPYEAFVAHELFAPLHMAHVGDLADPPRDLAPGRDPGFAPAYVTRPSPLGPG